MHQLGSPQNDINLGKGITTPFPALLVIPSTRLNVSRKSALCCSCIEAGLILGKAQRPKRQKTQAASKWSIKHLRNCKRRLVTLQGPSSLSPKPHFKTPFPTNPLHNQVFQRHWLAVNQAQPGGTMLRNVALPAAEFERHNQT